MHSALGVKAKLLTAKIAKNCRKAREENQTEQ
jgi:hypothetical protein